jgi:hypothetical protein
VLTTVSVMSFYKLCILLNRLKSGKKMLSNTYEKIMNFLNHCVNKNYQNFKFMTYKVPIYVLLILRNMVWLEKS